MVWRGGEMRSNNVIWAPLAAIAVAATACTAATTMQPPVHKASAPATATTPATAEPTCRAHRVVPCQCLQAKGYRQCEAGQLGECVCRPVGRDRRIEAARAVPDADTAPLRVGAAPTSARRTASGLAYIVLKGGLGRARPTATSKVRVHYTGWTTDGKMFDSSRKRSMPAQFRLNQLIPGWTEGLQLMVVGDEFRFWIPEALAYKGKRNRPQGVLVFDVELLKIH